MNDNPHRSYDELLNGLKKYVAEEIEHLDALVDDEDTFCPARDLRDAKRAAFLDMRRVLVTLTDWEW